MPSSAYVASEENTRKPGNYFVRFGAKEVDGITYFVEAEIDHEPTAADFEELQNAYLEQLRGCKVLCVGSYAKTDAVRAFINNGQKVDWLDSEARVSIRQSVEDKAAEGREKTVLYLSDGAHECSIETARETLRKMEVYAADCNDKVREHETAIAALQTIDEVEAYDYTDGFPEMPEFEL